MAIKVNDTMFLKQLDNTVIPVIVTKVGRKYLYVNKSSLLDNAFDLKTFAIKGTSGPQMLFSSESEFEDFKEKEEILRKLSNIFRYGSGRKYSLGTLREIKQLLDLNN